MVEGWIGGNVNNAEIRIGDATLTVSTETVNVPERKVDSLDKWTLGELQIVWMHDEEELERLIEESLKK